MSRKPADIRKAEIIMATLDLADRLGPDRLTTGAIAQSVGITQAALFRHFPTKQALWEAVGLHLSSLMEARWLSSQQEAASPLDRLRALALEQLTLIREAPALSAILFSRELHVENAVLRRQFQQLVGRFQALLATNLRQAQIEGAMDAKVNALDAASLVMGIVQGLALRWSLTERSFDPVTEGERLLALLLGGWSRHEL